MPNGEISGAL